MSDADTQAEFEATIEEFVDVGWRFASSPATVRRSRARSRVTGSIIFMVVAAVTFYNGRSDVTTSQWLVFAAAIGALGAAYFAVSGRIYEWCAMRAYRRTIVDVYGDPSLRRCQFDVRESGLWIRQGSQEVTVHWSSVRGAELDGEDVVIYFDPGFAVVRARGFKSEDHRTFFVSELGRRRAAA